MVVRLEFGPEDTVTQHVPLPVAEDLAGIGRVDALDNVSRQDLRPFTQELVARKNHPSVPPVYAKREGHQVGRPGCVSCDDCAPDVGEKGTNGVVACEGTSTIRLTDDSSIGTVQDDVFGTTGFSVDAGHAAVEWKISDCRRGCHGR
ncbi:MAG TPA: hypothetical protein VNW92_07690 [Polyangiaceae bacterium]|nr:hypothetical protein [Polyangiaceae bacterium]